jgi:hypothetical protein
MDCWFWNIDRNKKEFFHSELKAGRLRQGWSYREDLNLKTIQRLREEGKPLSDRQRAAWKRCKDMITRITPGDLVVVKNVPDGKHFGLARVEGAYRFEVSDQTDDQRHMLPVEYIGAYHKSAEEVSMPMIRALNREQHPIRRTLRHKAAVIALAELGSDQAQEAEPFKAMIERWRSDLSHQVAHLAHDSLDHRTAERLVMEMLRNDGLDVDWTAGPNERGADLQTEVDHGYGLSTDIAIQVKFHTGTEDEIRGLEQIEQAFEERNVDAGLLVTFADELSDKVEGFLAQIQRQRRQNVSVLHGEELYLRLLEFVADSSHTFDDE